LKWTTRKGYSLICRCPRKLIWNGLEEGRWSLSSFFDYLTR
jgi:hypothetical protein